jgi:hypothetical protein
MTTKAGGVQPSRAEIYIDTRTKKDGSIVTEKAAATIVELKKHIGETENLDNSQLTQEEDVCAVLANFQDKQVQMFHLNPPIQKLDFKK